jgi:hypothetical protein
MSFFALGELFAVASGITIIGNSDIKGNFNIHIVEGKLLWKVAHRETSIQKETPTQKETL